MTTADGVGRNRWRYANAHTRLLSALAVGVGAAALAALWSPWQLTVLVAWDVTALLVLAGVWLGVAGFDAEHTASFATREDNGRVITQFLIIGACVVSLIGTAMNLAKADQLDGGWRVTLLAAGFATIVISWATVHTIFMLRYAHQYYTAPIGGVNFNSDEAPDYRDFAYMAFTVGMTFQVADTNLSHQIVRRTVLRHALLSYLFGAVIVGVMVNVVATLL